MVSTSGQSHFNIRGMKIGSVPTNAFPGAFIGGMMTESTNALPVSYATSNLDVTGQNELLEPYILITAI